MRILARLMIVSMLFAVTACPSPKPPAPPAQPQPFPPSSSGSSGYTQPYYPTDNDDTYVPMNYYY